jgi:predicted Rossmann-fold nucleotide-binding protein
MDGAARVDPGGLALGDLAGAAWVFLSGYCLYCPGLLERCVELAAGAGCRVALDLGSYEIVRAFRGPLGAVLAGGGVALCFCNEDEAAEVAGGGAGATPEAGLAHLAQRCDVAVVTLGEKGCMVQRRAGGGVTDGGGGGGGDDGGGVIVQPACAGVAVLDTTGAGDSFAAGFLYALLRGYSLRRAAEVGCLAGGAVVQVLGSEMGPAQWHWLHDRLHGERAGEAVRASAAAVQQELLACYALIERRGRGVVYYGSARLAPASPHYAAAGQLAADVWRLLGCTTWTGGGPGMMEAATLGAARAGGGVAGIRIAREAGTTVRSAGYLPDADAVVCRFLSSRKVALVDSGVRMREADRTAFVFLPGGMGSLDELFELLTLSQLKKLGTRFPVPIILCSWSAGGGEEGGAADGGGYYDGIINWMCRCVRLGTIGTPELRDVLVARDPGGVLDALAEHYGLPPPAGREGRGGAVRLSEWAQAL